VLGCGDGTGQGEGGVGADEADIDDPGQRRESEGFCLRGRHDQYGGGAVGDLGSCRSCVPTWFRTDKGITGLDDHDVAHGWPGLDTTMAWLGKDLLMRAAVSGRSGAGTVASAMPSSLRAKASGASSTQRMADMHRSSSTVTVRLIGRIEAPAGEWSQATSGHRTS
jgi:hypothetical protein